MIKKTYIPSDSGNLYLLTLPKFLFFEKITMIYFLRHIGVCLFF